MSTKKKIIIISAIAFVVLLAGAVTAFILVSNHREQQRQQYISDTLGSIDEYKRLFDNSDDRAYRVTLHNDLSQNYAEFMNNDFESEDIRTHYQNTIGEMADIFFGYYSNEIDVIINGVIADNLIEAYSDKIDGLNSVKSMISTDGIFSTDTTRLNQLTDKADGYIGHYTDSNDWLNQIDDVQNRFNSADRSGRFDIYSEILDMQSEYENSSFENRNVETELESVRVEKVNLFIEWYDNKIEELSVYSIEECEDEDCEDCKEEEPTEDNDEDSEEERWEYLINAMIELNDLIELFDFEHETLFTQFGINLYYEKLDTALLGNLSALEQLGIDIIADKEYRKAANDKAIEHYNELFEEWKENHKDNDHLPTYEELIQAVIDLGKTEHDKIIEAERVAAERARQQQRNNNSGGNSNNSGSGNRNNNSGSNSGGGNNSGGGSTSRTVSTNCGMCGASGSWTINFSGSWGAVHYCDTGIWGAPFPR